jgi:hypothetical protein
MAWCLIKHRDNFTFPLPPYQCLKTFPVTYFVCLKNKLVCRILARRISDLEEAVQSGQMAAFPSQLLLEGYASSEVDRDVVRILSPGHPDGSDSEGDSITSIHFDTQRELFSV